MLATRVVGSVGTSQMLNGNSSLFFSCSRVWRAHARRGFPQKTRPHCPFTRIMGDPRPRRRYHVALLMQIWRGKSCFQ
jgi:hypothetical protein